MHKQTQRFHRIAAVYNHLHTFTLLLTAISLFIGCSQPVPVVYLSPSGIHNDSAANTDIYLSQLVVIADDLPEASQEIERFVRQKLTGLLVAPNEPRPSGSGPRTPTVRERATNPDRQGAGHEPLNEMSLSCHVKASQSVTFTEPLPVGFWIAMRFDLTRPSSDRIEKSWSFEQVGSFDQPTTLKQCLSDWLDRFADALRSSSKQHPYHLARGLSDDDRRGRQQVKQGNYPAALRSFQKAIDTHPEDHGALYNAGLMCEALKKYQRALNYYQRAYRISSKQDYQAAIARIEKSLP